MSKPVNCQLCAGLGPCECNDYTHGYPDQLVTMTELLRVQLRIARSLEEIASRLSEISFKLK